MSFLVNSFKVHRVVCRSVFRRDFATFVGGGPLSWRVASCCVHTSNRMSSAWSIDKAQSSFKKSLSSISGSNFSDSNKKMRAYPQYAVLGENTFLAVKILPPGFKVVKNSILSLDTKRKGRILLEFAPRTVEGKYDWQNIVRFGLSAEEAGLLINQLPHYKVELSRLPSVRGDDSESEYGMAVPSDAPEKVLTVEPGEHGVINFILDYVRDGIGGQEPGHGQIGKAGPFCVPVQAGEFEVIVSLIKYSLPYMTGWAQSFDTAIERSLEEDISRTQGGGSNYGGGGGNDVPF